MKVCLAVALGGNGFLGAGGGGGGVNCSTLNLEDCASLWKNPGYAPEGAVAYKRVDCTQFSHLHCVRKQHKLKTTWEAMQSSRAFKTPQIQVSVQWTGAPGKRLVSVNICSVEGNSAGIFVSKLSPGIFLVKEKWMPIIFGSMKLPFCGR